MDEYEINSNFLPLSKAKLLKTNYELDDYSEGRIGQAEWNSARNRQYLKDNGFDIFGMFLIYRIGWEADNYGILARKDGDTYCATTSHGSLVIKKVKSLIPTTITTLEIQYED